MIRIYMKEGNLRTIIVTDYVLNKLDQKEDRDFIYTQVGKIDKKFIEKLEFFIPITEIGK